MSSSKKLHFLLTSLGSVVVNISGASEQKQLKQTGKQHSPDHKIISNKVIYTLDVQSSLCTI